MVVSVEEEEERKRGGLGILHTQREERKKRGEKYLQQCPYFKVKKSKLAMVSILCQKKCVYLSFVIDNTKVLFFICNQNQLILLIITVSNQDGI